MASFEHSAAAGPSHTAIPSFGVRYTTSSACATTQHAESDTPQFDILDWYPQFQSCHRYFLDHAQHSSPVKALAAFINIQLPFQKHPYPVMCSSLTSPSLLSPTDHRRPHQSIYTSPQAQGVSLTPYIRRLVATGHDTPAVLHGFFGDDWVSGVGALHEVERRNYLFAAKSTNWVGVKEAYDMLPNETVPFLSPLQNVSEKEMQAADNKWSEWIFMQDWILGPRLDAMDGKTVRVKRETID